jgi:hypothetical protein
MQSGQDRPLALPSSTEDVDHKIAVAVDDALSGFRRDDVFLSDALFVHGVEAP